MPPILCYVTNRKHWPGAQQGPEERHHQSQFTGVQHTAMRAAGAGVDWIQVREKDLGGRDLLMLVESITHNPSPPGIFVNDRLDIARAVAGVAGVHLGGESVPVRAVAEWRAAQGLEGKFQIGRSCHSLEEARQAEQDGADYVFFGPVFETPEKIAFGPPQGVEKLAAVCRSVKIPVLAIGGITLENARVCGEAGAAGIAAIRLFQQCLDMAEMTRIVTELRRPWEP